MKKYFLEWILKFYDALYATSLFFPGVCFNERAYNVKGKIVVDIDEKLNGVRALNIKEKTVSELIIDVETMCEIIRNYLAKSNPTTMGNKPIHWTISQNNSNSGRRNYHFVFDIFIHKNHPAYSLIGKKLNAKFQHFDNNVWAQRQVRVNGFHKKSGKNNSIYKLIMKGEYKNNGLGWSIKTHDAVSNVQSFIQTTLLCPTENTIQLPVDAEEIVANETNVVNLIDEMIVDVPEENRNNTRIVIAQANNLEDNIGRELIDETQTAELKELIDMNYSIISYLASEPVETTEFMLRTEPVWTKARRKTWLESLFRGHIGIFRMKETCKIKDKLPKWIGEEFNKHFAYMDSTGMIYRREYDEFKVVQWQELTPCNLQKAYCELQMVLPSKKINKDGTISKKNTKHNFVKMWLESPLKRSYSGTYFDPTNEKIDPDRLNRFGGFAWTREECEEACLNENAVVSADFLDNHIKEKVCEGDPDRIKYMYCWLALKVLRPSRKVKVMPVLYGHEGTGKSSWLNMYGKYFGSHFYVCSSMNQQLKSSFNGHLQDKLFVILEEGFWAGNSEAAGIFKALITEERRENEEKFKNRSQSPNMMSFIMLTNNEGGWMVPAGDGARRFAIFRVKDFRKEVVGEKVYAEYFNKLFECYENDNAGIKAWFHKYIFNCPYFVEEELDDWRESESIPIHCKNELQTQKLLTCDNITLFWKEMIKRGYTVHPLVDYISEANNPTCLVANELRKEFTAGRIKDEDYEMDGQCTPLWIPGKAWLSVVIKDQLYEEYVKFLKSATGLQKKQQTLANQVTFFKTLKDKYSVDLAKLNWVENKKVMVTNMVKKTAYMRLMSSTESYVRQDVDSERMSSGISSRQRVTFLGTLNSFTENFFKKTGISCETLY